MLRDSSLGLQRHISKCGCYNPSVDKKTPAQPHALLPKQHSVPKLCLAVTDKTFPLFSGYAPSWLYRVQSLQFFTPFCDVLFRLGSVVKGKYPLLPFPFLPFGLTASCPRTLLWISPGLGMQWQVLAVLISPQDALCSTFPHFFNRFIFHGTVS